MADEKEPSFKISDRRLFNPDGTPRESAGNVNSPSDEGEPKGRGDTGQSEIGQKTDASKGASEAGQPEAARVISFPGEKAKDRSSGARTASSVQSAAAPGGKQAAAGKGTGQQAHKERRPQLPEASLEGLVNMLAVEAVMHLGLIEGPMGERAIDLEAARHVIDMLGVVQNKTKGNLTDDEADLLDNVLADLRMQYVGISRGR